ncbi:ABC transporter ATP-binding protein [Oscillospiraceae bacterium PP1C4]
MADIKFKNITFRYGDKVILNNLSLTIEESQIMGIVGPSGCGKTTLIRCLCGFIKPEQGEIYIGDTCIFSAGRRINLSPERRNVGVVFQDYAVWPHMTVLENIIYPMKKRKVPKAEMAAKAAKALEQVRMTGYEKHLPAQLSGGQQQRVAIARALVSSDDVIVLDEPITNLDAKLREEMLVEIQMIQRAIGTTIIYITHDQEAALQLCDKIAIMKNNGDICQVGTDEEIIKAPANRFVFSFIGVSNFIPMLEQADGIYFDVGEKIKYTDYIPDGFLREQANVMGIRPMNIVFNEKSPIKGMIKSSTFLGNQFNFFITLGNMDIRVQRNSQELLGSHIYGEGETVGLEFINPIYYLNEKEAVTV